MPPAAEAGDQGEDEAGEQADHREEQGREQPPAEREEPPASPRAYWDGPPREEQVTRYSPACDTSIPKSGFQVSLRVRNTSIPGSVRADSPGPLMSQDWRDDGPRSLIQIDFPCAGSSRRVTVSPPANRCPVSTASTASLSACTPRTTPSAVVTTGSTAAATYQRRPGRGAFAGVRGAEAGCIATP